jgi:hypothetical protein
MKEQALGDVKSNENKMTTRKERNNESCFLLFFLQKSFLYFPTEIQTYVTLNKCQVQTECCGCVSFPGKEIFIKDFFLNNGVSSFISPKQFLKGFGVNW